MLTVYRCVLPGSFDQGWDDRVEMHNRKVEQIQPGWHRTNVRRGKRRADACAAWPTSYCGLRAT